MFRFNNNKYKDDLPIKTVNRIKEILYKHNLIPIESDWKNSADGFHSLRVTIKGTSLATNGKGTTIEYALASAYAELMERIQNQSFYRLSIDLGHHALNYRDFYYSPDEKHMSIDDFINQNDEWTKIQISLLKPDTDLLSLLSRWKFVGYEDINCDYVTIPYLNLMSSNISHIPVKMASKMYMSNGMCAGNTVEEALVQGISEVLERYVNIKILKENICPPTIPTKILLGYPRIYEMIKQIEDKGNFKVVMKDCSLNKGFPVVSAIFINRDNQTYFIKFGSHPIIEIALERTLTELLQGQDVKNMMGVKEYSYIPPIKNKEQNIMGILVNGSGLYPSEYFSNKFSYKFQGFKSLNGMSNRHLLLYLLNILQNENYNVFVRDFSYLGFPSYHVIVPGFSEIESIDDFNTIEEYSKFVKMKKYIRNISNLNDEEINDMLKLMEVLNMKGSSSIIQLLNIEIEGEIPWYYTQIDLFKVASYIKIKNFKKAYQLLDLYLDEISLNYSNKDVYTYYKCVRDYIGTRIKYNLETDCIDEISKFYTKKIVNDVIEKFKNPMNIFEIFGFIKCWKCSECSYFENCNYKDIERVYKTLKDANKINLINQKNMIKHLNL